MAWVLTKETQTKGTDRLVLLSLANHANELWQAWPSVPRIAAEANVAERAVQRSIANLKALGILAVDRQQAPLGVRISADRRPNLYTINRGDARSTPRGDGGVTPEAPRGDAGGVNGVTLVTERGATGSTQIIIEPKRDPSSPESGERDTSLPAEQVSLNVTQITSIRGRLREGPKAS